jgi:hypothetical protein
MTSARKSEWCLLMARAVTSIYDIHKLYENEWKGKRKINFAVRACCMCRVEGQKWVDLRVNRFQYTTKRKVNKLTLALTSKVLGMC